MKLVLANNQSKEFTAFHSELQGKQKLYDYSGYSSLGFYFEKGISDIINTDTWRHAHDYDGVYINGYLSTPEIATTVATVLDHNGINYVNKEMGNAISLSKLSSYAKLAKADVTLPKTYAGAAKALLEMIAHNIVKLSGRYVLKRADADRGIDNFVFDTIDEVKERLSSQPERSLWLLQEFIPNDGFYLASFYHDELKFGIFRTLEERNDDKRDKAHMFKPKGGRNATLLRLADIPVVVADESLKAVQAMNRQIASVDSIYDPVAEKAYILEVNYNPQLVSITTFKEARQRAFLEGIEAL
jgi:glutathione synthase/RimK-type ligase-like ATP-grasp enzyme